MDKTEERYLVYGGIGLFLAVIAYTMLGRSSAPSAVGTIPQPSTAMLNFWQHEADSATAAAQAKAALAANTLVQYKSNQNALELGLAQLKTETALNLQNATSAQEIAQIQADAATKAAQMGYQAAQNVAITQANAADYAAQQAAYTQQYGAYASAAASQSASHAQQTVGIWQSITNFLGDVAGMFHFP